MKKIIGVMAIACISITPVYAEPDFSETVVHGLLAGCLPNALGTLSFDDNSQAAWQKAGFEKPAPETHEATLTKIVPGSIVLVDSRFPHNIILHANPAYHSCNMMVSNVPVAADKIAALLASKLTLSDPTWKPAQSGEDKKTVFTRYLKKMSGPYDIEVEISMMKPDNLPKSDAHIDMFVMTAPLKR